MYEEGPIKYMFLAGTKQILGGDGRASFFHADICLFHVHCTYTPNCVFGLYFLHMPFSRLHLQQYGQAITPGQPAYTM